MAQKHTELYDFEVCQPGTFIQGKSCADCPAGQYQQLTLQRNCVPCAIGTFVGDSGATQCLPAPLGHYVADKGQSAPTPCEVGLTTTVISASSCSPCGTGTYGKADANGVGICEMCPTGSYQDETGKTQCKECLGTSETTRFPNSKAASDCICLERHYYSVAQQKCVSCPEGFDCPLGSTSQSLGTVLKVKQGYWIPDAVEPYDVYMCGALDYMDTANPTPNCPGGGVKSCQQFRSGIACGVCDGYEDGTGICKECEDGDGTLFIFFIIFVFVVTPVSYFFVNSRLTAKMSTLTTTCVGFGSIVTLMQLTSVLHRLSIEWPDVLSDLFGAFAFFAFDLRFMKPACIVGNNPMTMFFIKFLLLPSLAVWLFGVSFLTRLVTGHDEAANVRRMLREAGGEKDIKDEPKSPWWCMYRPETFNTFGTIYQAMFITVIMTIIQPMWCYEHPNEKTSMMTAPQLVCGEGDQVVMFVMALLGCILFVLDFLGYFIYQAYTLPKLSKGNPIYYRAKKYMIYRFRADTWYWGAVFLVRNLLIAFATLINPSKPFLQMMFFGSVMIFYLLLQCKTWPWRTDGLNLVDAVTNGCMIAIVLASMAFAFDAEKDDQDSAQAVCTVLYVLCCSVVFGYFLWNMCFVLINLVNPAGVTRQDIKDRANVMALHKDLNFMCQNMEHLSQQHPEVVMNFLSSIGTSDQAMVRRVLHLVEFEVTTKFVDLYANQSVSQKSKRISVVNYSVNTVDVAKSIKKTLAGILPFAPLPADEVNANKVSNVKSEKVADSQVNISV